MDRVLKADRADKRERPAWTPPTDEPFATLPRNAATISMTNKTRKAIETLGDKLHDYYWQLHSGCIRCIAIDDTEQHSELELCPLAIAVTHTGSERLDTLMQDPEHEAFARSVNDERPDIRDHLHEEQPDAEPESLDLEATVYAAAAVVHDIPRATETGLILNLDQDTVRAIANAADNPDCETGRALVRALDSPSNHLRQEYEARYGKLNASDNAA